MRHIAPAALALAMATLAISADAAGTADSITVVDPYVRMAPPGAMATAAFMVLKNDGGKDAKLVRAENSVSKITELHTHLNEGGVMKMRQVPAVELPAGKTVELKPGGYHVMLMDLKQQVKEGDTVPLTLVIEGPDGKRESVEVKAPVRALNASAQPAGHDAQGGHKH